MELDEADEAEGDNASIEDKLSDMGKCVCSPVVGLTNSVSAEIKSVDHFSSKGCGEVAAFRKQLDESLCS